MVSQRNRLLELTEYITNCGVELNIGKTKAQGNRGFFKVKKDKFRIDISKNLSEELILPTLAHEFAHYIHYCYDKTFKSLAFFIDDMSVYEEEMLAITVNFIPKSFAEELFLKKEKLKSEKKILVSRLSTISPNYNFKLLEEKAKRSLLKYLLKYDRVKVFENFKYKIYSVDELEENSDIAIYVKIKSKQRAINRINSKISSLNRYYNSPTELFARSFELFVTDSEKLKSLAPKLYITFQNAIVKNKLPLMTNFYKILCNNL